MGLKREEMKKLQREKEFEEFLLSYGITKADLVYLPEALKAIKELSSSYKPHKVEEKPKSEVAVKPATPADYVKMFSNDVERFYPNADKPKEERK